MRMLPLVWDVNRKDGGREETLAEELGRLQISESSIIFATRSGGSARLETGNWKLETSYSPSRSCASTRATATDSGPSREKPLAHLWPPPPKRAATEATSIAPLLRRLTRQR